MSHTGRPVCKGESSLASIACECSAIITLTGWTQHGTQVRWMLLEQQSTRLPTDGSSKSQVSRGV